MGLWSIHALPPSSVGGTQCIIQLSPLQSPLPYCQPPPPFISLHSGPLPLNFLPRLIPAAGRNRLNAGGGARRWNLRHGQRAAALKL